MARTRDASHPSTVVLIVDDDQDTRDVYAEWLSTQGFTVIVASTAAEAIAKARRFRPDVIATDIALRAGEDGCDLCRRLKHDRRTRTTPIIAVTGWATTDYVERARDAGCDSVLIKPVLPETLLSEIRRVLNMAPASLEAS